MLSDMLKKVGNKLKQCPFCGGKAKLMRQPGYYKYYPYCTQCDCRLRAFPTETYAIEAWNKRKTE